MTLAEREAELEAMLLEREAKHFLVREAELLDHRELDAWLDLIADDISYYMPRRLMRENTTNVFSDEGYYFDEDYGSLRARVERFDSEYAWAERPPTRTERYVTNVLVTDHDEETVDVESNLLVYLSRGDSEAHDFYSAKRLDTLRRRDDGFELADRTILLNQTILSTDNVSIFL